MELPSNPDIEVHVDTGNVRVKGRQWGISSETSPTTRLDENVTRWSEKGDTVLVSLTLVEDTEPTSGIYQRASVDVTFDRKWLVSYPTKKVRANDSQDLQCAVSCAIELLLDEGEADLLLSASNIDREPGGAVIYLSLHPDGGQAGIVLAPAIRPDGHALDGALD